MMVRLEGPGVGKGQEAQRRLALSMREWEAGEVGEDQISKGSCERSWEAWLCPGGGGSP